ncbi:MAG TPA: hypothetical protein VF708_08160 [Pyrinomonadaceae bacterium]
MDQEEPPADSLPVGASGSTPASAQGFLRMWADGEASSVAPIA